MSTVTRYSSTLYALYPESPIPLKEYSSNHNMKPLII